VGFALMGIHSLQKYQMFCPFPDNTPASRNDGKEMWEDIHLTFYFSIILKEDLSRELPRKVPFRSQRPVWDTLKASGFKGSWRITAIFSLLEEEVQKGKKCRKGED
jgi:hypothetical protein